MRRKVEGVRRGRWRQEVSETNESKINEGFRIILRDKNKWNY